MRWCTAYNTKCLNGITQELVFVSMNDLDKILKKYCDSPRLSKLLLSWSHCGNKAINETVKCWQNYIIDLERISVEKDRIPNVDKTPLICWSVDIPIIVTLVWILSPLLSSNYHQLDHCLEEALISKGEDICSAQAVSGLHSMLNEVAGNTLDIFCGDYAADNDKCDAVQKIYKHLKDIKLEKPINKSPIIPFIGIVSNTGLELKIKSSSDQHSKDQADSEDQRISRSF